MLKFATVHDPQVVLILRAAEVPRHILERLHLLDGDTGSTRPLTELVVALTDRAFTPGLPTAVALADEAVALRLVQVDLEAALCQLDPNQVEKGIQIPSEGLERPNLVRGQELTEERCYCLGRVHEVDLWVFQELSILLAYDDVRGFRSAANRV